MPNQIISIAFAPDSHTQLYQTLSLADFTLPLTIKSLVVQLGWQKKYPQILDYEVGIFSRKVSWDYELQTNDRVEIYRTLTITPMRKRQLIMAQRQKTLNKQRAKNNIAKKKIDKKAYYNALRLEKEQAEYTFKTGE